MLVRGIDTDNYDGDVPVTHFEMLRRDFDVRFNVIGLEANTPYANQQREACKAAGIVVPFAYKFLYWTDNDLERMKRAAGFGELVAIDCEYDVPAGWAPERVVERIDAARQVLVAEGRYWGIYTGAWWWPAATRNWTGFSADRLWHAAYPFGNKLPPKDYMPPEPTTVSYGGWTVANVHQYANNCYGDELGPWAFDLNAADKAILGPPPPEPPEPVDYVVRIDQHFKSGKVWYLDVKPPPGVEA